MCMGSEREQKCRVPVFKPFVAKAQAWCAWVAIVYGAACARACASSTHETGRRCAGRRRWRSARRRTARQLLARHRGRACLAAAQLLLLRRRWMAAGAQLATAVSRDAHFALIAPRQADAQRTLALFTALLADLLLAKLQARRRMGSGAVVGCGGDPRPARQQQRERSDCEENRFHCCEHRNGSGRQAEEALETRARAAAAVFRARAIVKRQKALPGIRSFPSVCRSGRRPNPRHWRADSCFNPPRDAQGRHPGAGAMAHPPIPPFPPFPRTTKGLTT